MLLKSLRLVGLVAPMFVAVACGGSDSPATPGSNNGTGGNQQQTSSAKCTSACCTEKDNATASASATDACKTFCTARVAAKCENEDLTQPSCEQYFQCGAQNQGSEACIAASKVLMDCYRAQGNACKAEECCDNQATGVFTACTQ